MKISPDTGCRVLLHIFLVVFLSVLCVINSYGQGVSEIKVTTTFQKAPVKQALKILEQQVGYTFVYSDSDLANLQPISGSYVNKTLASVLRSIFGAYLTDWKLSDNKQIVLQFGGRTGVIRGRITTRDGAPISHVTVAIVGIKQALTNAEGAYVLNDIPLGKQTIRMTFVGQPAQTREVRFLANKTLHLDFVLDSTSSFLEEVKVVGKSTLQHVKELAYNVDVVDAKALHNTSLDLATALNRASGVRVRMSGGVGSDVAVNMNGFSGVQTRFFVDGIPMETYGSTYQINNIPIETADRIEVYKGVAPVSLAADALGGVVNIVTNQRKDTHLHASYSYGSFNTHKSFIDAGYTSKSGFNFSLNAYQNYSDNNYWVDAEILDLESMQKLPNKERVRRFNDGYHNETVIARVGLLDKTYADVLQIGVNLGNEYQESQSGTQMEFVYGERRRATKTLTPFLAYQKKNLFIDGLDVRLASNYNLGYYQFVDTTTMRYNWRGESKDYGTPGEFEYSSAKHYDRDGSVSTNIEYTLNPKHSFAISHILTFLNRKGKDPFDYTEESHMLGARKHSVKHVSGLSYMYTHSKDWSTSAFLKSYIQRNEGPINTSTGAQKSYEMSSSSYSYIGYGLASTYFWRRFQFKTSYEKTYRLPATTELFGDESFNSGNIDLKPESSDNVNLNVNYDASINDIHQMEVAGSFMFRRTQDYIIRSTGGTAIRPATFANHGTVNNAGVNVEVKYFFKRMLTIGGNFTYQDLRFKDEYDLGDTGDKKSLSYNTRVPNQPYIFGNGFVNLNLKNVFVADNMLSLGYNTMYVHEFPLHTYIKGTVNVAMVPTQFSHNAFMAYKFQKQHLTLTGEVWNLTDEDMYDNWSLQRPGRSYTLKIGYSLF